MQIGSNAFARFGLRIFERQHCAQLRSNLWSPVRLPITGAGLVCSENLYAL